jgi:hypothetical protein
MPLPLESGRNGSLALVVLERIMMERIGERLLGANLLNLAWAGAAQAHIARKSAEEPAPGVTITADPPK